MEEIARVSELMSENRRQRVEREVRPLWRDLDSLARRRAGRKMALRVVTSRVDSKLNESNPAIIA